MANNRLYIVNTATKEYIIIAKQYGEPGWGLGNIEVLKEFLNNTWDFSDKTTLIIGAENDTEFFNEFVKDAKNFNENGGWEYA